MFAILVWGDPRVQKVTPTRCLGVKGHSSLELPHMNPRLWPQEDAAVVPGGPRKVVP